MKRTSIYASVFLLLSSFGAFSTQAFAEDKTYMCEATSGSGKHIGPIPITASSGPEAYEKLMAYLRSTYPDEEDGGVFNPGWHKLSCS